MVPIPGQQFAFVLRVRLEADSTQQPGQPILRGMLQPIGSETVRYFSALEHIPRILQELLAVLAPNPSER